MQHVLLAQRSKISLPQNIKYKIWPKICGPSRLDAQSQVHKEKVFQSLTLEDCLYINLLNGGKLLCAHIKSEFDVCTCGHDL